MPWTRRQFLASTGVAALSAALPVSAEEIEKHPAAPEKNPAVAALGVLQRTLGADNAARFTLSTIAAEGGQEVFELSVEGNHIHVAGSTAGAIARGAYTWLRESGSGMVTWSGSRVEIPASLTNAAKRRVVCPYKFTQFYNPCTFGYTMPFWDWARWERELDWLALHGINMPLALDGQEAIWQRVWKGMGLTDYEIAQFSVGPAHQPWHWMGNINNFAGPNLQSFVDAKRMLQRRILDRMRELGMKPVAPGFSGFVPEGMLRVRPETRTFTLAWSPDHYRGMPRTSCTYMLDPNEAGLYREIGKRFIQEYKAEYGEVSHYLCDAFNELQPPVTPAGRSAELEQFGKTIYEGITAGDPNGVWVMQGWLFTHLARFWDEASVGAFVKAVPDDRMVILDYGNDLLTANAGAYGTERWRSLHGFMGKGWINGMAHAFGGNTNVTGNLPLMASQPAAVLHDKARANLVGWGICPEGTQQNEVCYELMTDMGWSTEAIDLDTWIPAYCRARYGSAPDAMVQAWKLLRQSAYGTHLWGVHQAWQREPVPTPAAKGVDTSERFTQAVQLFASCADVLGSAVLYRNDLIELVSQVAGGRVDQSLALAVQAIDARQYETAHGYMDRVTAWLTTVDGLMNTRSDRRLETWVADARRYGRNDAEAAFLESNGRMLITFWGWPELSDYACRVWSGLTRDYYLPRWINWLKARIAGAPLSTELWEITWLSRPYNPSKPMAVTDVVATCNDLLSRVNNWKA